MAPQVVLLSKLFPHSSQAGHYEKVSEGTVHSFYVSLFTLTELTLICFSIDKACTRLTRLESKDATPKEIHQDQAGERQEETQVKCM